jgi:hypothetical protein
MWKSDNYTWHYIIVYVIIFLIIQKNLRGKGKTRKKKFFSHAKYNII